MKLPDFVKDSYALYKKDTSLVVSFIRLSIKSSQFKISVGQLEKACVELSEIDSFRVPKNIISILKRLVANRKKVIKFYQGAGINGVSTKSHIFFVEAMERVLGLFVAKEASAMSAHSKDDDQLDAIFNRFEALTCHDVDSDNLDFDQPADGDKGVPAFHKSESLAKCVLLEPAPACKSLAAWSLLNDIYTIRTWLKIQWSLFAQEKITLPVVSFVTQQALQYVWHKTNEFDILYSVPEKDGWYGLVEIMLAESNSDISFVKSFLNTNKEILMYDAFGFAKQFLEVLVDDGLGGRSMPIIKPNHFGIFDDTGNSPKLTSMDRLILFMDWIPEWCLLSTAADSGSFQFDLVRSIISPYYEKSEISTTMLFLISLTFDVIAVNRKLLSTVFQSLKETGSQLVERINTYSRNSSFTSYKYPEEQLWLQQACSSLLHFTTSFLLDEPLKEVRDGLYKSMGIVPAPPAVLFRQNPFYCGEVLIQVYREHTRMGIALMQQRGTLLGVLHLYNGVRQYNVMDEIPLFEKLVELFGPGFFPNGRPQIGELAKTFHTSVGVRPEFFASSGKKTPAVKSKSKKKGKKGAETSDKMNFIHNPHGRGIDPSEISLFSSVTDGGISPWTSANDNANFSTVKGGPVEYLNALKEAVDSDWKNKKFGLDFLLIDQLCLNILRSFHKQIDPVFKKIMPGYFEYETQLTFDIGFAFRFIEEAQVGFDHRLFSTFAKRAFEGAGNLDIDNFLLPNVGKLFSAKTTSVVSFPQSISALSASSAGTAAAMHQTFIPPRYSSIEKRYDFFLAACAMRVDDLLISCTLRIDFFTELLVFSNMAHELKKFPDDWKWEKVVEKCRAYVGFDDDDAEDAYHGTSGLQMLRKASSSVYGSSIYTQRKNGVRCYFDETLYNPTEREKYWQALAKVRDPRIYENIGGRGVWPF